MLKMVKAFFLLLLPFIFTDVVKAEEVKGNHVILTKQAPAPIGPFSQAILADGFLFVSGQIGVDPTTSKLVSSGFEDQVKQAFTNLKAVAEAGGAKLSDAVKLTLFVTDMSQFSKVNEVMKTFFVAPFPARSTVGVAALPLGASFEVEGIFSVKK